jgi:ATP-dependent RNA helicase RhlE
MQITRKPWPKALKLSETPREEEINQLREVDRQKRIDNPEFKGAFHEKRNLPVEKKKVYVRDKFIQKKRRTKTRGGGGGG